MARRHETEQGAPPVLGVGMVGYAFMGAAHSQGWRTAGHVFDLPMRPALAAICGRDRTAVEAAAAQPCRAAAGTCGSPRVDNSQPFVTKHSKKQDVLLG